jgi:hypothetical protein
MMTPPKTSYRRANDLQNLNPMIQKDFFDSIDPEWTSRASKRGASKAPFYLYQSDRLRR